MQAIKGYINRVVDQWLLKKKFEYRHECQFREKGNDSRREAFPFVIRAKRVKTRNQYTSKPVLTDS